MRFRTKKIIIVAFLIFIACAALVNFFQPVVSSTRTSASLDDQEFKAMIELSKVNDCSAMMSLGDHFFFGVNNVYGAIFWYERSFSCGHKDAAKYLKQIYRGLGLLTNKELERLEGGE